MPILVVDDNATGRYAKLRTLERAGFEVVEAENGAAAFELIELHKPRLVILDVNLPDADGVELCRRIKTNPATNSIAVLQISATYVREEDTVRALENGADASLVDPVDATVLVATVRALLRSRQAEETVRNALAREQAANRMKDEFLAVLSHELRSPLGAILTWVTLLRGSPPDAALAARGLAAIERNTRLQVKLVEDLLDVSRIISGKMQIDPGHVDVKAIIGAALEAITPAAQAKDVRLSAHLDPQLRPLRGDAARLQQVVTNLLSNAVKFTPALGRAEVQAVQVGGGVEISVVDTGMGIEPDFLPHVFERFQQADSSTTRNETGLGLGLAIVRHLVELHGGSVRAESEGRDRGARFTVVLPSRPPGESAVADGPLLAKSPAAAGGGTLDSLRVLVVDDDPDSRDAIVAALSSARASVRGVTSVAEGMAALARAPADVVVSDIGMPREDGYELVRRLRASTHGSHVAALALTAYASIDDHHRALAAGFDGFITKPADAGELVAVVARLARERHKGNGAGPR